MSGLLLALLLMQASPIEPLRPGTVSLQPLAKEQGPAETRRIIEDEVQRALMDANFIALPAGGQGRYTARVTMTRVQRGTITSTAKPARASGGLGNWGGGLAVSMPTRKAQLRALILSELTIELVRRGETTPAWTGRATTAQAEGTEADTPANLARKLASVVLRQFPAQSDGAVSVP